MSNKEDKELSKRILEGIRKAQRLMLERKAKLGESVIYADADGNPYEITAAEALARLDRKHRQE